MGCVELKLNETKQCQNSDDILITSRCSLCTESTQWFPMSKDTW